MRSNFARSPGSPGGLLGLRSLRRAGVPPWRWCRAAGPPTPLRLRITLSAAAGIAAGPRGWLPRSLRTGGRTDGSVRWAAGGRLLLEDDPGRRKRPLLGHILVPGGFGGPLGGRSPALGLDDLLSSLGRGLLHTYIGHFSSS
ncbi:hypothetical protein NDU88_001792 [Pleurodeles waltl]|uniref:Uncharacterized protein n=1 Tax=Pleurodeles waltl TaxID=8319 RepID=A0AAV7KTK4_PLEWA|nr:hypothetical protein NDU88_001792 [Pleurodeles waltl]